MSAHLPTPNRHARNRQIRALVVAFGVGLNRHDQVPEVGPDRELLDVHAEAGVVADLGLLAADQGQEVISDRAGAVVIGGYKSEAHGGL